MKLTATLMLIMVVVTRGSLMIPAPMISPLGVPASIGSSGMTAIKLAIGTRLLNMLGSSGIGPTGNVMKRFGEQPDFMSVDPFAQLTPKSKDFSKRRGPNIPSTFNIREASPTEIENFFGVLHRVDSNKCISRLVCEIGANPKVIEGLGHNVKDVMSSLQILEKNTLSTKYRRIMLEGQDNGTESCAPNYPTCDQKSYRLVRTFVRAFRVKK